MQNARPTVERLPADRWRTPGSWERSCISKIDSPLLTDPPEPAAPEGFLCPKHGSFEISRRKPERETRIPGLALGRRVARKRGACRRERGASRIPMAERTMQGFANGGAPFSAPQKKFLNLVCRLAAAQPTLVVKMSHTSLQGKAGSNPAFDARTVDAASRGLCAPRLRFCRKART